MNKIFIIEDDEIDQLILIKLLTTLLTDVHVVSITSSKGLADKIGGSETKPVFIIVNKDFLAVTGWSLLNQLNELQPSIPIYIASHWFTPADALKATHYPFVKGLFEKPLSEKTIAKIANENNLNYQPYVPEMANF